MIRNLNSPANSLLIGSMAFNSINRYAISFNFFYQSPEDRKEITTNDMFSLYIAGSISAGKLEVLLLDSNLNIILGILEAVGYLFELEHFQLVRFRFRLNK